MASGTAGTVLLSWLAPSTGAPASYTVTASPGGATKTVSQSMLSTDVTDLISGDNVYTTFTVTSNGKTSNPSNPAMIGADLGADHDGQNLRVTWAKRTSSSTGWRRTGTILTPRSLSSITGITLRSGVPGSPDAVWNITRSMTLTGLDLVGSFWIMADNVVFDRCRITSSQGFRNYVTGSPSHWQQGLTLKDCEVIGVSPAGAGFRPNIAFRGGPFTIQRCEIYGYGDVFHPSANGAGDSGWLVEDCYTHSHWDGVDDTGIKKLDTPHADCVQMFGRTSSASGTVGLDNHFRRNTFDVRYPEHYRPGTNGYAPRLEDAGDLDRGIFYGSALGPILCNNVFDSNIFDGGGFMITLQSTSTHMLNVELRRNRMGLNYMFSNSNPVLLDGPAGRGRYIPGGSPYGSIQFDASNVWDLTGTTVRNQGNAGPPWVPIPGQAVVADTPVPVTAP